MGVIGGRILLLTITGVAVLMDLYQMKIKNSWILFSMLIGFGYPEIRYARGAQRTVGENRIHRPVF